MAMIQKEGFVFDPVSKYSLTPWRRYNECVISLKRLVLERNAHLVPEVKQFFGSHCENRFYLMHEMCS